MRLIVLLSAVFVCLCLASATPAHASPISAYASDEANQLHTNVGFSSAPETELGYGRRLTLDSRRVDLEAALGFPVFRLTDFDSFRLEPSARAMILHSGHWGMAARVGVPVETGHNEIFSFVSVGARATVMPGYYAPRGFVALEASATEIVTSYVAATDRARLYDRGTRDGFYAPMGGYFDLGLAFSVAPTRTLEVGLRAGLRRTQTFQSPPLLPLFGELGVTYAF